MTKPVKPKRKSFLTDHHDNEGIGLMPSDHDIACRDRVYAALSDFLTKSDYGSRQTPSLAVFEGHADAMLLVVRYYNADKAYDDRFKFPEMKTNVRSISRTAYRLHYALTHIPRQVRNALNVELRQVLKTTQDNSDHIQTLIDKSDEFRAACAPILASKGTKRPRTCVANACSRLWDMLEQACDRQFVRTWVSAKGRADSGVEEFANFDAQFVLTVMMAIDPDLSLPQVRDGLKQQAKARMKSKSMKKRPLI